MTIVIFLYKDGLPCYNSRIYGHRTTGKEYLMAKTADTIAIYSRKSRYTGKGESIGNQIDLCREYIRTHYGDAAAEHTVVFEDEGFSGGNLNRPDFKKMMTAAKDRKFKAIVVYRLDRISRNISDFSSLIEELGRLGIDFVSIRESFDTSSPMGRAMMYIASVFSQLERETIAERIRDNMHELAKTGRWLGGTTPTGYASESVKSITVDGKTKKGLQAQAAAGRSRDHLQNFRPLRAVRFPDHDRDRAAAAGHQNKNRAFVHPVFHQVDFAESCLPDCRQGRLSVFCGQ